MNKSSVINPVHAIEMQEIIEKLRSNGYAEFVDCLLDNDNICYTKRGRLNKSALIRKLGCKSKQLEDALEGMRTLLNGEFQLFDEDEDYDEEGEFMHHCVATYSDKQESIIVSVRTADKKDRVTCEFKIQDGYRIQQRHFCNQQPPEKELGRFESELLEQEKKRKIQSFLGKIGEIEREVDELNKSPK